MNDAEFRCMREYLGLPHDWLARHLQVNERAVRRWEQGERAIPEGVFDELLRLAEETQAHVTHVNRCVALDKPIHVYRNDRQVDELSPLPFVYLKMPAAWYRHVAARVMDHDPDARLVYIAEELTTNG